MHVLVVDDSRAMRGIVRRAFRQAGLNGHTFIEASSAAEALDVCDKEQVDLALLDMNLDDAHGLELARTLRRAQAQLRFGFVTCEADVELIAQARAQGALFVLAKPFTSAELRAAVAEHVTSAAADGDDAP